MAHVKCDGTESSFTINGMASLIKRLKELRILSRKSCLQEDNVLVGRELSLQKPESIIFSVNPQPLEDVIKVNVKGIRIVAEVLTEGHSEELL